MAVGGFVISSRVEGVGGKKMLLGTQFAWDQLAVSEQCGQTSQHAATHPKVNIESQGLESTRLSIV